MRPKFGRTFAKGKSAYSKNSIAMNMKKIFLSRQSKIVVDILMLLTFLLLIAFMHQTDLQWKSAHCIFGLICTLLMLIHTAQHWKFTKAVITKKAVMRRNKITFLTVLNLLLLVVSVLLMIGELNVSSVMFHHGLGKLCGLILIIHIVQKFKRLLSLFKKETKTISTQ